MRVQWAHVLDEDGSADFYDNEVEARQMLAKCGGGLDRIETTTVEPYAVLTEDIELYPVIPKDEQKPLGWLFNKGRGASG